MDQYLAARVVVVHHQYPRIAQRPVQVSRGLLEAGWVQGQGQPQGIAGAGAALDAKLPMHQANQLLGDYKPQVAAQPIAGQEVPAVQFRLQQRLAIGCRQGVAAVLHRDAQAGHLAALVQCNDKQDFPLVGVFQRVFHQARQRLAQAGGIAADHTGHLGLGEADQLDVLLLGLGPKDVQAVFD